MSSGGDGERPRGLLELLMGEGGPIIVPLMGPRGGEGGEEEAPLPAEGILLLVLRREGGEPVDGGLPPASKASIEAMRTVERPVVADGGADGVDEDEEEECAVCLGRLWVEEEDEEKKGGAGALVKEMPCGHRFHGGCIDKWLGLHGCCPLCRHRMPEEEMGGGTDEGEEMWVAFRFSRTTRRDDGEQQQQQPQPQPPEEQQQPMEEVD